ncbi:MAG: WYL domain-containing protein [Saprospiraceae bacterium]
MKKQVPPRVVRIIKLIQYLSEYPPKKIEQIALHLEVHPKTVYKDVELLGQLGYETEKDHHRAITLKYSGKNNYHLTDVEKKLIISTLPKVGLDRNAVQTIVMKLKTSVFPDYKTQAIFKHLYIIKTVIEAIKMGNPLKIKRYKSTNPMSPEKDRYALPLKLEEKNEACTCLDIETKEIRIYKTSRMQDVEIIPRQDIKLPDIIPEVDVFGIAGKMEYKITLALTKRSSAILTEEFGVDPRDIEENSHSEFEKIIKIRVCGYEGVGRFVLGMLTEIKVVGDDGFKNYLKKKIAGMTII